LNAARDGTLYQHDAGGLSNGAGQHLFVGTTAAGFLRRTVIAFDVAGSIPAGSTITSVVLTLDMSRTQGVDAVITLHRLLAGWDEGTADAPGNEGAGAPSAPGDVTWLHRSFDSLEWAEAGGDFLATPHAHAPVAGRGEYTWESTQEMVADVQSWLDDPEGNYGWLLKGNEEDRATARRFGSRESENPEARPRLTVEYILPPPGP
jgi:hypothetical protein